ncbi:MAG: serine/threonine-protein kinase [Planctomycetes bacterium]|nr:serine/threonine-protein kinase [Planctomycetota bacterium]MBL7038195.1 serine/threonine-protein kinase [Pirellulaceae bacterium]
MSDPDHRELPNLSEPEVAALGQLGEYQLLEILGEGGMGIVYRALHTELDRVVALKVLAGTRTADEQTVERFKREMKAVGRLDHPNIIRAHDARQIEGIRVLVMEYVDGLDLAELVERLGPLPIADACELIRQAAVGLQHAHEHGLVHRDIKPSNLMLDSGWRPETGGRREEPSERLPSSRPPVSSLQPPASLKILDLGLARFHVGWPGSEEMTAAGQLIGTPDYMAPEQASDSHAVDIRADLYSLGCTLYHLLAGRAPFSGPEHESAFSKVAAHLDEPIPPIRQYREDVPDELVTVLDRMLAKAPHERFSNPSEVADALSRSTSGSDLPELLADAERMPSSRKEKAAPVLWAQQRATPMVTQTRRDHAARRGRRFNPIELCRRRPLAAAGTVGLLAIGLFLAILVIPRLSEDNRVDSEDGNGGGSAQSQTENGSSLAWPSPAPGKFGPPVNVLDRPQWQAKIILSWTKANLGKPDLWLFSPSGTRPRRVTDDPASFDLQPQFSPNGRRIVFLRTRSPNAASELWLCDTDGSNARRLVAPKDASDRLLSPVWVSDSRIYFARGSKADRSANGAIWQVDVDAAEPRLVFRFHDALGQDGGLVTDTAPDGRHLLVVARQSDATTSADVYITDLDGSLVQALWEDPDDDHRDARAIWSPDGKRIAWQHDFERGCGVGLARLRSGGEWTTQLQPEVTVPIMPVAWTPDSQYLLCARVRQGSGKTPSATLFLMDQRFEAVRELFDVDVWWQQHSGRLADWAILPTEAIAPARDEPILDSRRP